MGVRRKHVGRLMTLMPVGTSPLSPFTDYCGKPPDPPEGARDIPRPTGCHFQFLYEQGEELQHFLLDRVAKFTSLCLEQGPTPNSCWVPTPPSPYRFISVCNAFLTRDIFSHEQ